MTPQKKIKSQIKFDLCFDLSDDCLDRTVISWMIYYQAEEEVLFVLPLIHLA